MITLKANYDVNVIAPTTTSISMELWKTSFYISEIHFTNIHDDVIKWKYFPRYWPFVRGIHRSPVNSPHKGQWRGALMFTLICARINVWVNTRKAGDLRRNRVHYDVIVMRLTKMMAWMGNYIPLFYVMLLLIHAPIVMLVWLTSVRKSLSHWKTYGFLTNNSNHLKMPIKP